MIRLLRNIKCLHNRNILKNDLHLHSIHNHPHQIFLYECFFGDQIKYCFGIFRKEGILKRQIQDSSTHTNKKTNNNDIVKNIKNQTVNSKNNSIRQDKQSKLFLKSKSSQSIFKDKKNDNNIFSNENQKNQENNQFFSQQQKKYNESNIKNMKDISAFKAAQTVKQLLDCIYQNDHIKRIKNQPTMPFFIKRMIELLTKEEYLKNQKEVSELIYDIKSFTNQNQCSADEMLAIFYLLKKVKDYGYDNKIEGFQIRYTTRLFQLLKNNQLTFQQILFAYYITAYLGCSNHDFKWHFTMSMIKQFDIYIKNKNRNASEQMLKESIILSQKNVWTSPRSSFLRPSQCLMIMSAYRFYSSHLISDMLIYECTLQNIWNQRIHSLMNFTEKVQLFNIYLSMNMFFLIQKNRLSLIFPLSQLNMEFFHFIKKQPKFYQNNKWISIIQNINFYEFNYNKLSRITNNNILHQFSSKILDCIINPKHFVPTQTIMKFLITPVINKTIKTQLLENNISKMSKIQLFVRNYFQSDFFKQDVKNKQITDLWTGFVNVDYQKIKDKSIFSIEFMKNLYSDIIMKKLEIDLASQTYWMLQFSGINFLQQKQIEERLQLIFNKIKVLSQSPQIDHSSHQLYKIICKFYAYTTKYLEIYQQNQKNSNIIIFSKIKQSLKKALYEKVFDKGLNNFISQKLIQKILPIRFNIIQFFQTIINDTKYHQQYSLAEQLFEEIQKNVQVYAKQVPIKFTKQFYCLKILLMMKNKSRSVEFKQRASQIFKLLSKKSNFFQVLQIFQASVFVNAKKIQFQYTITDFSPLQVQYDIQLIKQNYQFFCSNVFQQIKLGHFNFLQIIIDNFLKYDLKIRNQIFKVVIPTFQKGLNQGKFQLMKNSKFIFILSKFIEQGLITIQQNQNLIKIFQNIHKHVKNQTDAFSLHRSISQITKNLLTCDLLTTNVKNSIKQVKFPGNEFTFNLSLQIIKSIQINFTGNHKHLLDKYEQKYLKLNLVQINLIFMAQFLHINQNIYEHLIKILKNQKMPFTFKMFFNSFYYSLPKYQTVLQKQNSEVNKIFFTRKQQLLNILMSKFDQLSKTKWLQTNEKQVFLSRIEVIKNFQNKLNSNRQTISEKSN